MLLVGSKLIFYGLGCVEQRLLLLPGEVYGRVYERFVRVGFGCEPGLFQEGLTTLL